MKEGAREDDQGGPTYLDSFGTSKSRASTRLTRQMQAALEEQLHQRLNGQVFVALRVDGIRRGDHTVLAALGVTVDGQKTVLGLQKGPRRMRLPPSAQDWMARKLRDAYREPDYATAKRSLLGPLHRLKPGHPGAAKSLQEGLEETLMLQRLGIPGILREFLASTNLIESAFSTGTHRPQNITRWRNGQQALRSVGAGLLIAEQSFRRIRGYRLAGLRQEALRREVEEENRADGLERATSWKMASGGARHFPRPLREVRDPRSEA